MEPFQVQLLWAASQEKEISAAVRDKPFHHVVAWKQGMIPYSLKIDNTPVTSMADNGSLVGMRENARNTSGVEPDGPLVAALGTFQWVHRSVTKGEYVLLIGTDSDDVQFLGAVTLQKVTLPPIRPVGHPHADYDEVCVAS
ncbi:MAG: hypothetical protein ABTQ34_06935 [Bdellovibrionales bacterium]